MRIECGVALAGGWAGPAGASAVQALRGLTAARHFLPRGSP